MSRPTNSLCVYVFPDGHRCQRWKTHGLEPFCSYAHMRKVRIRVLRRAPDPATIEPGRVGPVAPSQPLELTTI